MTPEEASKLLGEQKLKIAGLEAQVANWAQISPGKTMLAIMKVLVEMVCVHHGPNLQLHYKEKFYKGVLALLDKQGIR